MTELMIMFHVRPAISSSPKHTVAYGRKVSELMIWVGRLSPIAYGTNMTELMVWVSRLRMLHIVCAFLLLLMYLF
jgi:hypothetical protein